MGGYENGAVIIGAGNIGRGFVGQLLSRSGFRLTFVDASRQLVGDLNRMGEYPLCLVEGRREQWETISGFSAVWSGDGDAAAECIARAGLAATAVGVSNLEKVAPLIARGIRRRMDEGLPPLNILVCENKIHANRLLARMVCRCLPEFPQAVVERAVGFVEVSVGRMVPAGDRKAAGQSPLLLRVEPYHKLPYDEASWRGERLDIYGAVPCDRFDYYIQHKLFLHNMGHAAAGYLGSLKGYAYMHEAMADPAVERFARSAMEESARMLGQAYPVESGHILDDVDDLLRRFANRALFDPLSRVCADPLRKLEAEDRLVGAARRCARQSVECTHIMAAAAAALLYHNTEDPGAVRMQAMIGKQGLDAFCAEHCGISGPLLPPVKAAYRALQAMETAVGQQGGNHR